MSKALRVEQLPENSRGALLYCWKCGGEYSCTRSDYFWAGPGYYFYCTNGHSRIALRLVRREHYLVEVEA